MMWVTCVIRYVLRVPTNVCLFWDVSIFAQLKQFVYWERKCFTAVLGGGGRGCCGGGGW